MRGFTDVLSKRTITSARLLSTVLTGTDKHVLLLPCTQYTRTRIYSDRGNIFSRKVFQEFSFIQTNKALRNSGNLLSKIPIEKCLYTSRNVS